MNPYSETSKRVIVPMVFRRGTWVPYYGGPMPKFHEGTRADLILATGSFRDPEDAARFTLEESVELLPAGTCLWAKLSPNYYSGGRKRGVPPGFRDEHKEGFHDAFLEPFKILVPLKLQLHGTKPSALVECECLIEGVDPGANGVLSVNQAYTRLSEHYEPGRRSHTGNVFTKVFYRDPSGPFLRPLKHLREQAEADLATRLFHQSGELALED